MSEQSEQPMASWWARNWIWMVPVGCVTTLLVCAGLVTLFATIIFGVLKTSDAYEASLKRIRSSPEVQMALGSPVEAGFLVTGNIEIKGPSGHADISYRLSGPKASGTAYVTADKAAGQWVFMTLVVELEASGDRIDLLAQPDRSEGPID